MCVSTESCPDTTVKGQTQNSEGDDTMDSMLDSGGCDLFIRPKSEVSFGDKV